VTTGGATVPLSAVEPVLRAAATGEVVVVGLPHTDLGAVLAVVLTSPADHGPLLAEARRALVGAHRPRVWFHVADLPFTPAGKVDRAALVSLVSGADERVTRLV
jgi:acyl-CoA synthetase (AMP-forming)/AMP-acid ligase II